MSDDFNFDDFDLSGLDLDALDQELADLELEDIDLSGIGGLGNIELKEDDALKGMHLHTVMIVDDDAATLRNIKSLLDGVYNVVVANHGVKALEILDIEKPDVILLDYEMPRMNGPETMKNIRLKPEYKNTPIIFLTGVNDRDQITAALSLRPDGYLLKPVNKEKLMTTIMDILNRK